VSLEDLQKELTEIENKLVSATNFFQKDYDEHIAKFDLELASKEENYLKKLIVVEDEKNAVLKDLTEYKEEISKLTKEYVTSMDTQLEKIKIEEKNFETEKQVFVGQIEEHTKARKLELEDYSHELGKHIEGVIVEHQEKFQRHEDTFREVFNEKISKLGDFQKKKLESIEKKFIEKNLKYVDGRIAESLKELKLVEESIVAKVGTVELQIKALDNKEDNLAEEISIFEDTVSERIEERLMNLEKSMNKRFLGIEEQFSSFKGVIVDEVEDLMKEVETLVSSKLTQVDKHINKMNFAGSEVVKKLSGVDTIHTDLQKEIAFVRDDLNDLRVKSDVNVSSLNTNDLISYMSDYEQNLVHLIKSLKSRQIKDLDILETLSKKGHPIFYVKMVMSQINSFK